MEKTIIFLHGFGGNKKEYTPLIKTLKEQGLTNLYGFNYKEKFGQVSLTKLAKDFNKFVKAIHLKNQKIYIVGISQGGIIASYWLEFLGGKKICQNIITLCTPFKGSLLGYLLPLRGVKELRKNSQLLKSIRTKASKSKVNYYGVWNPLDLMVFPGNSGKIKFQKKSKCVFSICHPTTFWAKKTKDFVINIIKKNKSSQKTKASKK